MRFLSRLGVRLAAVTLMVGLVGGLLGGWLVQQSTRDAIETEAGNLVVGLADRLAGEIDSQVDNLTTSFRALSTRQEVSTLSPGAQLELAVALRSYDNVTEFALYDGSGAAVAAAAKGRLVRPSELPTVALVPAGERRTEVVRVDPTSVDITVAVESPPGTSVGSLRGRVRLDTIVQGLEARLLGPSAIAVFVGADGTVLDHPERNRVLTAEAYPVAEVRASAASGVERGGDRVLAAKAATSGLAGSIVIEWDEREAFAVANREAMLVGYAVALVVLVAVGALLLVTTWLVRPLEGLRLVLRRLGDGDHDARAAEVGSTEFKQVAVEVNAMAVAVNDQISALRRARSDVDEAQAKFQAAFEQAPVAMAISTPDTRFIDVNPAMCALLQYPREHLLATTVTELTHPDHRELTRAVVDEALTSGAPGFEIEKAYLRADGHAVPTLTKVACVRSATGEVEYFIAHLVDLSELRDAEERFRSIVDSSPDVFIVMDDDRRIDLIRGRVRPMFGYEPDQLAGLLVDVLVPELGLSGDSVARRADGELFPVEITLSPIVIAGEPRELVTVRDVTERRAGEAARRELHDMRDRQRQAIEINDNIVQGLTIARWSFDLGEVDAARDAVQRTVETARLLVDRMLSLSGSIQPGALRREHAMGSDE